MLNKYSVDEINNQDIEFLENCDLGSCDHRAHALANMMSFDVDQKDPEALIISDTIASIASGMSLANKQIVKDTLLFATLAASAAFPAGGTDWYKRYVEVLAHCGWFSQQSGLSDYRVSNSRFTMDQVALDILQSAILAAALPGPTSVLMLKVAKDTVDALQKNEKPLRLFENSAKNHSGAKFAIASSAESTDGEVIMAMGALSFNTSLNVTNVLFWEWSSSSVHIQRAENHLTLNQVQYERVRSVVERRLTDSARDALEEFDF